jgi:hypothetical protein
MRDTEVWSPKEYPACSSNAIDVEPLRHWQIGEGVFMAGKPSMRNKYSRRKS